MSGRPRLLVIGEEDVRVSPWMNREHAKNN